MCSWFVESLVVIILNVEATLQVAYFSLLRQLFWINFLNVESFVLGLVVVFFSFLQTALSFVKCRGHIQSNVRNSPSRKWLPICISYGAVFEYDSTHFQWVVWPQRSAKRAGNSSKQSHYIFFSFWLISMIRR